MEGNGRRILVGMSGGVGGSLARTAGAQAGAPGGGTKPGAAQPGCSIEAL